MTHPTQIRTYMYVWGYRVYVSLCWLILCCMLLINLYLVFMMGVVT